MSATWLMDEEDRVRIEAHVFGLLRRVGHEPRSPALLSTPSDRMGARLKAYLQLDPNLWREQEV